MPRYVDRNLPLVPQIDSNELQAFLIEQRQVIQDTFAEQLKRFEDLYGAIKNPKEVNNIDEISVGESVTVTLV